jgi:tetratricopeptide (TPR) repeat protein
MHPVAIYHFSAQIISRRTGRSSTAAAAYRAGEIVLDENTGEVHDYTRKRGVIRTEIIAPRGSPAWVFDRSQLWSRVELGENRKDSQVCREIEISIPHELTVLQGQLLMIGFVQSQFVAKGMVADIAFHRPGSKGDNRNFHAHVTLTMRKVVGDGFGQKERNWNSNALLQQWREQWAIHANRALEQAGHAARIDHRSHADRGLLDVPGSHHGPAVAGLLARGEQSHVADRVAEQAAAVIARQLLNAQAAAERLRIQAEQAQADVQREMEAELERVQALREAAERAEREAQVRAAAEAAERAMQAAETAKAQALAAEQAAQAAEAARRADEAQRQAQAAEQAAQAAERTKAIQAVSEALNEQERAQRAVDAAERKRQALWPAYDTAMSEQRQAGESLLATARAIPKIWVWQKAIDAYEAAVEVLDKAQNVLHRAGRALAAAMSRLEAVDPAVRERRLAQEAQRRQAYDDQQRRIAEASSAAAAAHAQGRQRGRVTVHHQGPQAQDDQERGPDVPRG